MITVQGVGYKEVRDLILELLCRDDLVWSNTFSPVLHTWHANDVVFQDFPELLARLATDAAALPVGTVYELPFEILDVLLKISKSVKHFTGKAQVFSTLYPEWIVLDNLCSELAEANKINGQILHFGDIDTTKPQHVVVLNEINRITARIIQIVVRGSGAGNLLIQALAEVGFCNTLCRWVTGEIKCNMQAGANLRKDLAKVACTKPPGKQ